MRKNRQKAKRILDDVVGKEKAETLVKKTDKQLQTAEAAIMSMLKEKESKKQ